LKTLIWCNKTKGIIPIALLDRRKKRKSN